MLWSSWKGALFLMLAWVGVALGQHNSVVSGTSEPILTINEPGKAGQKCRVLHWWDNPDGSKALDAEVLETGERITVENPPPLPGDPTAPPEAGNESAKLTKIYRWGNRTTRPKGFPAPPITGPVVQQTGNTVGQTCGPVACEPCQKVCAPVCPPSNSWTRFPKGHWPSAHTTAKRNTPKPRINNRVSKKRLKPKGVLAKLFGKRKETPENCEIREPVQKRTLAQIAQETPVPKTKKSALPEKVAKVKLPPLPPPPPPLPKSPKGKSSLPASKTEKADRPDPLVNPEKILFEKKNKKRLPAPPQPYQVRGKIPPGGQSVMAANNGLKQRMKYLPVPLVTIPTPANPPGPPPPQVPKAPQLNTFVNAFSPRQNPNQQQQQQGYPMPPNSHMNRGNMQMPYPMPPNPQQAYRNPMPKGYPMPPQMAMANRNAGYPVNPYQQQRPRIPGYVYRNYPGPQAPNPVQNPNFRQVNFQQGPYSQQGQFRNNPMDRPGRATANSNLQWVVASKPNVSKQDAVYQLLITLKTAIYPAQREWAAMYLSKYDPNSQPEILRGLLTAAREDPAATVRAGCITALGRMKANKETVASTLRSMRRDIDPRVRNAAEQTMERLGIEQPEANPMPRVKESKRDA